MADWIGADMPKGIPLPREWTAAQRFAHYVAPGPYGCWLWRGPILNTGYGIFKPATVGKVVLAHRWSYQHHVGAVPGGLQLDHLCRVRHCVNPEHLEPVTIRENVLRGVGHSARNARKTHCKRGHPLSGPNLRIDKTGRRNCRACQRDIGRRYRLNRKLRAHAS